MIHIIAAHDEKRGIGRNGALPWHIPEDLKRFKKLTAGHPVIMGRKTWESLPESVRPLPERTNIVVTTNQDYKARGAYITPSIESALHQAAEESGGEDIFVIGGAQIYGLAIPYTDRLHLTVVETDADADTFFPEYEDTFGTVLDTERHDEETIPFSFVTRGRTEE